MTYNLSFSDEFSTLNFQSNISDIKDYEAIKTSVGIEFSKSNAYEFVFRIPGLYRIEKLYCLHLCHSHSSDHDLVSKEQKSFYPTNSEQRIGLGCHSTDKTSLADRARVTLKNKGLVELLKIKGIRGGRVRFSEKFFLQFCLHELEKKRNLIINDQTRIRLYTESDFQERAKIENLIIEIEKELTKGKKPQESWVSLGPES